MAPKDSHLGKRVKLTSVRRPFVYGTTARPYGPNHPKPPGVPEEHTHSWEVFVRGIDPDVDVTYWLRRVQFKLHESIANHIRVIDADPGKPFVVHETGWGEFEITIRLFYTPESGEKPQTLYHYLKLHAYGNSEEERAKMSDEVRAWQYDEQLFNEPYDSFFRTLTSGAHPKGWPDAVGLVPSTPTTATSKKSGGKGGGGKGAQPPPLPPLPDLEGNNANINNGRGNAMDVWQRTAMIPASMKPKQPYSRDTEASEIKKILDALERVKTMQAQELARLKEKEAELARVRAENAAAGDGPNNTTGGGKAGGGGGGDEGSVAGRAGKRGSKLGGGSGGGGA